MRVEELTKILESYIFEGLTEEEKTNALSKLSSILFIPKSQKRVIGDLLGGEEGTYFVKVIDKIKGIIDKAPNMYETDGKEKKPVLHFFGGSYDSYAYELDKATGEMFGHVNLGYGFELGYFSMDEINTVPMIELDLYFDGKLPEELN